MRVTFTVPGRISGGKERPRYNRETDTFYKLPKAAMEQGLIRFFAQEAMRGKQLITGPVYFQVLVFKTPPQSWSKKKQATTRWVVGKPDFDNGAGHFADAIKKIVWHDDNQVAAHLFLRQYTLDGNERIEITVQSLEEVAA